LDVTVEQEKEWQQQYEVALAAIEACKGPTVEWAEAVKKVEEGRAMASGTWKLQADATGNLLIGSLVGGGEYSWTDPIYLPPVLVSRQWHEADRSERESPHILPVVLSLSTSGPHASNKGPHEERDWIRYTCASRHHS